MAHPAVADLLERSALRISKALARVQLPHEGVVLNEAGAFVVPLEELATLAHEHALRSDLDRATDAQPWYAHALVVVGDVAEVVPLGLPPVRKIRRSAPSGPPVIPATVPASVRSWIKSLPPDQQREALRLAVEPMR